MYRYTPQDITEILLVVDHRITRITKTDAGNTANLSQRFAGISNMRLQDETDPRALKKAVEELQSLFFEDDAIAMLAYPVLKACEKSIDRLTLSTEGLRRPAFLGEPPLVKEVAPNYNAFLGTDFKFSLYGDDVSSKISFDKIQLELMVSEMVKENLQSLHKKHPELFQTSTPQKFFDLNNNYRSYRDFDPN